MKTSLHIGFQQLFKVAHEPTQFSIKPSIKMAHGNITYFHNQNEEAILQEFDGLLGFINMIDLKLSDKRTIPLQIEKSDLHVFYLMESRAPIIINDLKTNNRIEINPLRGRYFYLPTGTYELILPKGRTNIFNFYFRCSIFRDGNERPYQFLHALIAAYRNSQPTSCSSVDFRIGPRTRSRIHLLLTRLKKGDLDNESHILQEIKELIKLSGIKIFEEYQKLSSSQLKAREAYDLISQSVDHHGQNFNLNSIAEELQISSEYLNEIFHQYYKQSPSNFKYACLEEKIKNLLLDGVSIVNVAYICGYTEGSRLSKFFKKRTGLTPTQYIATTAK